MTPFTIDAARALPGSPSARSRREAAAERAAAIAFPSTADELWRYSRIAELDLDAFVLGTPAGPEVVLPRAATAKGVTVSTDPGHDGVGSVLGPTDDLFAAWNDALVAEPVVITVPGGVVVEEPVTITHHLRTDGVVEHRRVVIDAGPDSEVTVVERFTSDDVHALLVPVVELRARDAARLRYLAVNQLGRRVWMIGSLAAEGERDSSTLLASAAFGGDYARQRSEARLVGQGAEGRQVAVYFGEGSQMHDVRTLQRHAAPKTTSDLLFKGAVQDRSRSVYTGLIRIDKGARGSAAFQTNRNLVLSEGAWAESVPNLDIEDNDVRCSHASAVGPVDEEQRFYLESRGVPPAVAERLIVFGFFDEVLEHLPMPSLVPSLRAEVAAKLDRRSS